MPVVFDKLGIRFTYPENWRLDETEALQGAATVTVYSPGGSFWSISLHAIETVPEELVAATVKALRETYDELDAEPMTEAVAGHESGRERRLLLLPRPDEHGPGPIVRSGAIQRPDSLSGR